MPLYLDIHQLDGEISVEDVKKAHEADKAIEHEYGVICHQFWVNEGAGMIFCLAESPDKESFEKVHLNSHGNVARNVVEVKPGHFKLFMGDGAPIDHGLVLSAKATADPAYRHLMTVDIRTIQPPATAANTGDTVTSAEPDNVVLKLIDRFKGRLVEQPDDEFLVGVFDTAVNAVRCAKAVQLDLAALIDGQQTPGFVFRIGLCSGFPLTVAGDFFSDALLLGRRLCLGAPDYEALVSGLTSEICKLEDLAPLRSLAQSDESFLTKLFEEVDENLSSPGFNVDHLSRSLGISRPQLYRKMVGTTGRSTNHFISSIRMQKALTLVKNRFGNVSEIALEVGYRNPSYFSRCFQKYYGCTPSEMMKAQSQSSQPATKT